MISRLHFLNDNLTATPIGDDQVQITVTLPADYLFHFSVLLDSLTGFVDVLKREDKLSRTKADRAAKQFDEQAQRNLASYHQRIVKAYDAYTSQGLNRNAAIKQISADLRADSHPWSSPDLVRPSLIEAGRSGRVGRPRRQP